LFDLALEKLQPNLSGAIILSDNPTLFNGVDVVGDQTWFLIT
jgi:hypothetical protein